MERWIWICNSNHFTTNSNKGKKCHQSSIGQRIIYNVPLVTRLSRLPSTRLPPPILLAPGNK